MISNAIDELAELVGIEPSFYDIWGNLRQVSQETKRRILQAMGFSLEPEDIQKSIERLRNKKFYALLDPVYFFKEGQEISITFYSPEQAERIIVEVCSSTQGMERVELSTEGKSIKYKEQRFFQYKILLPPRSSGYYDFTLNLWTKKGKISETTRLVVSPLRCYLPVAERLWGIYLNLYSLRSEKNLGVGDLGDLRDFALWAGKRGADFVGINPLHLIPNTEPYGVSPYSPLSRLYRNPLYIDISRMEDAKESERVKSLLQSPSFRKRLKRLRSSNRIYYEQTYALKRQVLELCFEYFYENHYSRGTHRASAFIDYVKKEGKTLEEFSRFMALYDIHTARGIHDWTQWSDITPPDEVVLFHKYLQWILDIQLKTFQKDCHTEGMRIGLYTDIAIGSTRNGFDAWANRDLFVSDADIGAPPDAFNQKGQNWGIPPINPHALRERGYRFFIELLRRNMPEGGAIRIDHILGFFRLYWIPKGMSPQDGAYIRYPVEELLSILALESQKRRCLVIGEDLGTVPPGVRETLQKWWILSFRLLYFEKDYSTGEFLPPERYPTLAAVSPTTHDLPTIAGFWTERDIEIKTKLDLYPDEEALHNDKELRRSDKCALFEAIRRAGIEIPQTKDITPELVTAIYRFLFKTPCLFVIVNLDDILMLKDQQNMPGTLTEYPSWRQALPYDIDEVKKRIEPILKEIIRAED